MTFSELRKRYTRDELSYFPGDNELRFRAFSPIIKSLYESKLVYYEKFLCIVKLEDIEITPQHFSATAVPFLDIERAGLFGPQTPTKPWSFESTWGWMRLINNSLNVPSAGWTIWPEAQRVRAVERLVLAKHFEEALLLTFNEPEIA